MGNNGQSIKEWKISNYLNKHNIHKEDIGMQQIIMNSFVNERGVDNDANWKEKVDYIQNHFGLFTQYAQNNWK